VIKRSERRAHVTLSTSKWCCRDTWQLKIRVGGRNGVVTIASSEEKQPNRPPRAKRTRSAKSPGAPPPRLIDWTGERCVPWASDLQVVYEHYHRYLFAAALAPGRRVLDLATGEGYGAALLATQASEVVAVELDDTTVQHARANYRLANLTFERADILDLANLPDGSFDLVTCFEALEHVNDHDRLLAEVLRVLTPEGTFVVSTPDRLVYSGEKGQDNPFHVHELSADEFAALLSASFRHVRLWGHNVAVGSLMLPLDPESGSGEVLTLTGEKAGWTPGVKLSPTYLLAVASAAPLPELPGYSTLVDTGLELIRRPQRERDDSRAEVARLLADRAKLVELISQTEQQRDEAQEQVAQLLQDQVDLTHRLLADHDATLLSLRQASRRADHLERRQENVLADLRATRIQLESSLGELNALRNSAAFPVLERGRRALDRLAPERTLRRRAYRRLLARAAGPTSSGEGLQVPIPAIPPFPTVLEPEVSIILPVHNNWVLTAACLRSLTDDVSAVPYELIVVDDASTDATRQLLSGVAGITVVHLTKNVGFIGAVNAGLSVANGSLIVLLNNDAEVRPGWLEALERTVELEDNVGVVGAKLVYPDGRLQEAGGIIWSDGSGWNYGRGADPGDPAFNFLRDVDYCSGACLLVRKEILDAVGGLDRRFAPAYYEDSDLAFAARKLGYRVVYQPEAVVCHIEGASNGTEEGSGIKRYQQVNRAAFRLKWQAELAAHWDSEQCLARLASRHAPAGRVLVVDDHVPTPNRDSGSTRMCELLLLLCDLGFAVTFVPHDGVGREPYTTTLQQAGIEVLHGQLDGRKLIRELAPGLDVAILSRPDPAWRWRPLLQELAPATKIIYDTVDLHFLREGRRAESDNDPSALVAAAQYYDKELSLARMADATLVVSEEERQVLLHELPGLQVHVLGNIHRPEHLGRPFEAREGVLFVGSFPHPPNRDAAHWLVEDILPLVHLQHPRIPTYIVGSYPTDDIRALASDTVQVLGWVPDLRDLYERARLSVAPLRYGAGVKGKVGQSLAFGLPVVTTRLGAEGMGLEHGRDVLVADGKEAFAAEILRAYQDAALWTRLATNGRQTIAQRSSPSVIRSLLATILVDIGVKLQLPDASRRAPK